MTKLFISLAAVAGIALTAAPAFADTVSQPVRFVRDGMAFVVVTRTTDSGDKILTGYEEQTGRQFTLRVSRGRVNGEYGGDLVSYDVPAKALGAATSR